MLFPLHRPELPLRHKLFGYMLVLVSLLLAVLLAGLFLLGSFTDGKSRLSKTLEMQLSVFEKEISAQTDGLAAAGIVLSGQLSERIGDSLAKDGLTFSQLEGSQDKIEEVEKDLFEPLRQALRQADCSGAFLILNTSVSRQSAGGGLSRSGLYLQKSGVASQSSELLLYRGNAEIGKSGGAMPHRKWRLEFRADKFPDFAAICQSGATTPESGYRFSRPITLPGTSESVMLLSVPLTGADGTIYGTCGFEISESYFKQIHAQPTQLSHLTCVLTDAGGGVYHTADAMSCGVLGGYYAAPKEDLTAAENDYGFLTLTGQSDSYVGAAKEIRLSPNNPDFVLLAMTPKQDYDRSVRKSLVQKSILIALTVLLAIGCCMFFSRRFLSPLLKALEQIRRQTSGEKSGIPEINDLLEFLEEQDRLRDAELSTLIGRQRKAEQEARGLRLEIEQLTGEKRESADPDRYAVFRENLSALTPKEREVFDLYADGRNAKEIQSLLSITENTLKYHNRNLYSKLGISTRRELLQFTVMLRHDQEREDAT